VVGALFNPIGIAIGSLLPLGFVTPGSPVGIDQLLLCEAIIVTVAFVLIAVVFADRPEQPPSSSQEAFLQHESEVKDSISMSKIMAEVKACFESRDFCVLFVTFGVGLGLFNSLTTLIEQITGAFGATSDESVAASWGRGGCNN